MGTVKLPAVRRALKEMRRLCDRYAAILDVDTAPFREKLRRYTEGVEEEFERLFGPFKAELD